ncbi:MAG: flagellar basal body protein FliL [Gammaproteobacteria bacterium]|nr:flagellar basal body protein FliL [Gammaproteobacteria bacterium]
MAEEVQLSDKGASKSGALKWVIIGVAAVLLITGSVVGTLFTLGMLGSEPVQASAESAPTGLQDGKKKAALYVSIDPPFTVNFQGNSRARFLQVSVDVMTREPLAEESLKRHMPAIRNNLVMLFSSKTSSELASMEGKRSLQRETLAAIQDVLEEETGHPGAEAVFFTNFVMQ